MIALLSLGVTLTYMTTRVFNFAHPRLALVAAYVTATVLALVATPNPQQLIEMNGMLLYQPFPLWFYLLGIVVAAAAGAAAALVEYFVFIKPLIRRGAGFLTLMIATLGFDFILVAILFIYSTLETINTVLLESFRTAGSRLTLSGYDMTITSPGVIYRAVFFEALAFTIGIALFFYVMLSRTKIGVMMRASIENPALARVLGINVERIYAFSWFLAGASAGLAGYLILFGTDIIGKYITATSPSDEMIVSVFAGSIVGGIYSIFGGLGGGFLIGIVEQLLVPWLGTATGFGGLSKYAKMFSMLAVVVTLLFIPRGLASLPETRVWKSVSRLVRRGGGT
jgi:branched-chain amino acid transport system permease protein